MSVEHTSGTPAASPVSPPPVPVRPATIQGSEESSLLLDNFTAYVAAVDGRPVPGGRTGWSTALEIPAGRHVLTLEFRRGVFAAATDIVLNAGAGADYQVKFSTDAELFGRNSFCDFWIVDARTGQTATGPRKAAVRKGS